MAPNEPGLTINEVRAILSIPKRALQPMQWVSRPNHHGYKQCSSALTDLGGVTLPGLTVVLEARMPVHVGTCLFQFTIFKLKQGKRLRAYQLEVCPLEKRSHVDATQTLYGPHEHMAEVEARAVDAPGVHCGDWAACLDCFQLRCNLTPLDVLPL